MIDAFVDTNVFVYAVDADEPEKRATAIALLDELKGRIAVSAQVLNEYYVAVTRKLARPQPIGQAELSVRSLAKLPVVDLDRELVLAALALSRSAQLSRGMRRSSPRRSGPVVSGCTPRTSMQVRCSRVLRLSIRS